MLANHSTCQLEPNSTLPNKTRRGFSCSWPLLGCICIAGMGLLAGCSDGGSAGDPDGNTNDANVTAAGIPSAQPVDPVVNTTSTEDLKIAASDNISNGIGINLDGFQSLDDNGLGALDTITDSNLLGNSAPLSTIDTTGDSITDSALSADASQLLNRSLGLVAGDNSTTTRNGDRITVDPDEFALCTDNPIEGGGLADLQRCQQLLSDVIVHIDPVDSDSGSVTYLFRGTPVLILGYSSSTDSFEINLAGLKLFSDAADALDPMSFGEASAPTTMRGSLRVTSIVDNANAGAEAGSLALDITQAIAIADDRDSVNVNIGTGTLFSIFADAASGEGGMEFNAGAASLQGLISEDLVSFNLAGFTGRADISNNGGRLVVSNLGIGRGPLIMNINNAEVLRATMETFGFEVDEIDNELIINGNLDINYLLDSSGVTSDSFDALSFMLNVTAPSGTGFLGREDGSVQVTRGGPFSFSFNATEEGESLSQTLVVEAGQCIDSAQQGIQDSNDGMDDELLAVVACE